MRRGGRALRAVTDERDAATQEARPGNAGSDGSGRIEPLGRRVAMLSEAGVAAYELPSDLVDLIEERGRDEYERGGDRRASKHGERDAGSVP